jgi:hypothetical protein
MKKEGIAIVLALALTYSFLVILPLNSSAQTTPNDKPSPETKCFDTGAFSISNIEKRGDVSIKRSGGSSKQVDGEWRTMSNGMLKFFSEDMAAVNVRGGYYTIFVGKSRYGVTCPPFKFSCKMINISINGCYSRDDTFYAKYTAFSMRYDKENEFRFENPFILTYESKTKIDDRDRTVTHSPDVFSPEFETINLSRIRRVGSNTYTVRWITPLNVSKFMVSYDTCERGKYAFYDSYACTDLPSCTANKECMDSERCEDNLCLPISCGSCQYLGEHECIDFACCGDTDCNIGSSCVGGTCQPLNCEFDEHIVENNCEPLICEEDEYLSNQTCSKLNCAEDEVAINHICQPLNCADNETVVDNSCEPLNCGFLKTVKNNKCMNIFASWFSFLGYK